MSHSFYTKRMVTHEEARECLNRLIASHFRKPNEEHARISIPANPDRDDDLLMGAYIEQQKARLAWRPIETAPGNGRRVLARLSSGVMTEACRLDSCGGKWIWPGREEANWSAPTHWLPLPEPPEEK